MHGKLICIVFLLHNTILLLLSCAFATSLLLFWGENDVLDRRYTNVQRAGIVWPNFAAVLIAVGNGIGGFITFKKNKVIGCYVYMALCVVCVAPPLSLTRVIRIDDPFEGVNHEAEDEAFELIIVVNAFACAFFGSNFICFYNAFTLQYAWRTRKAREANLEQKNKSSEAQRRTEESDDTKDSQEIALRPCSTRAILRPLSLSVS